MLALLAAFAVPTFVPLNHKSLPPSKTDFVFVAMGDNRPAGAGLPPTATFKELLKEISFVGPEFILSTGDLLYGNDDTLDQFKQEEVWMKPILDTLPCPFFNVPGNHEINNSPAFLAEYTKTMGPTYGAFDFGGYRFLAVCTELPNPKPSVTGEEMDWLKGEMSDNRPTFVYEHHPVFKRESNPEDAAAVDGAAELHRLYQQGGVKAVFEGHDHVYNAQVHDGIRYCIAGGSGAPLDAPPTDGGFFHFVIVHVNGEKIEMTPVPMGAIEVLRPLDGVAVCAEYADLDLPVSNLRIDSALKPTGVTAEYTTKSGTKKVEASLIGVENTGRGWMGQVRITLPKHRATTVKLTY